MRTYHDMEWGVPVGDDRHLFEKICLEAFQCGLSWSTILARRARLRDVFAHFDISELVYFTEADVDRIVLDPTVIRHRGKISAVIANARACQRLVDEVGSLGRYLWSFAPEVNRDPHGKRPPSTSDESTLLARDLKRRGWSFVGPTTMYALMQSIGMINDHDTNCSVRSIVGRARSEWIPPGISSNREESHTSADVI
jgi:DNA-3-methyladenine glycosylase I